MPLMRRFAKAFAAWMEFRNIITLFRLNKV